MYINKHSAHSLLLQRKRNKDYRHNSHQTKYHINLTGMVIEPSLTSSILSCGCDPSIVHPTDWHVPRISFTVPERYLDMDRGRMVRAMSITWSIVILPLCLTVREKKTLSGSTTTTKRKWLTHMHLLFFCFFRSLGGSLRALIMREAALGTTSTLACRFWMVSLTVTFSPFHSCVALAISSPTFFGD